MYFTVALLHFNVSVDLLQKTQPAVLFDKLVKYFKFSLHALRWMCAFGGICKKNVKQGIKCILLRVESSI